MEQLIQIIQQQQTQISQLITAQQVQTRVVEQQTVPALPDVDRFEPTNEKSRIADWLKRFKFALDCSVPTARDEIKDRALINKLFDDVFSEYCKLCLPKEANDFTFDETVYRLEKHFAKIQSIFIDRYECLRAC